MMPCALDYLFEYPKSSARDFGAELSGGGGSGVDEEANEEGREMEGFERDWIDGGGWEGTERGGGGGGKKG